MEWVYENFGDEPTDLMIADIELRGVVEVTERGAGFTEEYKAERERESGGADEVDEPEAADLYVDSWVEEETWQYLNSLRQRREPFPVAIGPFVFELMGIADLEKRVEGEHPEAIHVSIHLQEYRELIVQRQSLGEVLGGGQAAEGGAAGGAVEISEGWIDDGTGHDVRTGLPIPEMEPVPVPAGARPVYNVGSGQSYGRRLFQASAASSRPVISASGGDWAIQDVGLDGPSHNANDSFIGALTQGGGGRIDHVWMGDGTPHPRGTGIWWNNSSNGPLHVSTSYGALWRDNWIYGSAPKGPSALYENNLAYNNEVSSYRLNNGTIRGCVAHHDSSHSGRGARCVWVWAPGPVEIVDSHLRADVGHAVNSGANNDPGGPARVRGGGLSGSITSSLVSVSNAGSPNVNAYHQQIPGSAIDAARGYAPGAPGFEGEAT